MSLTALPVVGRLAGPRWLPLAAVIVAAVALRLAVRPNADVSWGLTMAERWLDGARFYVDLIEVNPPATIFLYVAPVALGRLIGIRPEIACDALVFIAIALSLAVSARILAKSTVVAADERWPLLALAAIVLAILPAQAFGEREHIATIAMLPLLAVACLRAAGARPPWAAIAIAGLGGGLTAIIKPYFVLAIVAAAGAAAVTARSWRVLFAAENWLAAALLLLYGAFVWLAFPAYFTDMLPLLAAVYVPVKEPLPLLLVHAALPLWLSMLLLLWRVGRGAMLRPPSAVLIAASAGFAVAYVVQQKGWAYHSYPMLALAMLALGHALIGARTERFLGGAAAALIAGVTFFWMNTGENRAALAAPIRAIAANPKILALSDDLSLGHPIVRMVDGVWVARVCALWIAHGAIVRRAAGGLDPATAAALDRYEARERAMLRAAIAGGRPDVILLQASDATDWLAWARADPALAGALARYRPAATVGEVRILARTGAEE